MSSTVPGTIECINIFLNEFRTIGGRSATANKKA